MVDYRSIAKPASLKAVPVTEADQDILATGVHAAIGVDPVSAEDVQQLDIRYGENRTYVTPIGGPAALTPWTFAGFVSPEDCRTHFRANHAPTAPEGTE